MNGPFRYERGQSEADVQLVAGAGLIATSFRTLAPLSVARPLTVEDALAAIAKTERPCIVAGGTDLPAKFNEGFSPGGLIDISRIASLRQIERAGDGLLIGATVTHAAGSAHPLVRESLPSFAAAWAKIANVRVRFAATIGGNLMARRTRYEGSILLSALGARARLRSAEGETEMPVEALWSAPRPRAALLTGLVIPLRGRMRFDYERSLRPIMTQALALDEDGNGRLVTATEFTVPVIRSVTRRALASGALQIVDPVASPDYLRRVSAVFFGRQLQRMGAS